MELKKAAMFGLDCRALIKQSGGLFLVSRHSEASKGANGSCGLTKCAAMFGLDARIALAIFALLTIIAGASLLSVFDRLAINKAVGKINEVEKALTSYLIDTGNNVRLHGTYTANFLANNLVLDGGYTGWKGPYVSSFNEWTYNHAYGYIRDAGYSSGEALNSSSGAGKILIRLIDNNYVAPNSYSPTPSSTTCPNGCSFWLIVGLDYNPYHGSLGQSHFARLLDDYYDNGDGSAAGKFQWRANSGIVTFRVKMMPKV